MIQRILKKYVLHYKTLIEFFLTKCDALSIRILPKLLI